ncbi:41600_t:CDS:2 [Gigaspora margarita]|uniref:41600_t:CDS:1 n=1 Tax=Gigaspora margarita TaxID=4874 RepID=A0ABM8W629_GIGMA|nr:41600_t:CDS:2 [Gigaspora margarita]
MNKDVLCTCIWCLQVSNGQGKSVSKATCTRHLIKQKKTWPDTADMPIIQRNLATSTQTFLPDSNILTILSIPLPSILIPPQTNQDENSYNHIIDEFASIYDLNIDSSDEQSSIISNENDDLIESLDVESLELQEELFKLLEVQEDSFKLLEVQEELVGLSEEDEEIDEFENLIKGLKLFRIKDKHNISETAFNKILKVLKISNITLYRLEKYLKSLGPLKPLLIDCCINSCVAFTGNLINKNICPRCQEPCYKFNKVTQKSVAYWSLIDSLKIQYKDKTRAETFHYRYNYTLTQNYALGNQIGDVFNGFQYKSLVSSGFFSDCQDVALMISTDRYQIFHQKRDDCWVILVINANLLPDIHVLRENLMISTIIPGLKALKDFNSFLQPLVNELKQLQDYINDAMAIEQMNGKLNKHEVQMRTSNSDYILSNSDWAKIGKIMEDNRKNMLLSFGHPFIDIQEYIQNDSQRILATLISYHYLLHIAISIYNTGPAWATWQYPIERLCGMLLPLVPEINHILFDSSLKTSDYSEDRVFTIDNIQEKLYSPLHLGAFDIINVSAICRNVGFLRLPDNEFYIIDQENRIKFQ